MQAKARDDGAYSGTGRLHFLVVDVEELFEDETSIEHALVGGIVEEATITFYPKEQLVERFGAALRTAYTSGKCTISDEFY